MGEIYLQWKRWGGGREVNAGEELPHSIRNLPPVFPVEPLQP